MKKIILLIPLLLSFPQFATLGQKKSDELLSEKQYLISGYFTLEALTIKLDTPVSQSYAKVLTAEGLWYLDRDRAMTLLRQALELTLPSPTESKRAGKEISKGVFGPDPVDLSRRRLRSRIFEIAQRDKQFRDDLLKYSSKKLGESDRSKDFLDLANSETKRGNVSEAERYINTAAQQGGADSSMGVSLYLLAATDREAADRIILSVLPRLRASLMTPQGLRSTLLGLDMAVFGEYPFDTQQRNVSLSAPEVIRAYLIFSLDKIYEVGSIETGGLQDMRGAVISVGRRIAAYCPELRERFQILELQSRLNPNDSDIPASITPERQREYDEEIIRKAEGNHKSADLQAAIRIVMRRNDFSKARDLADLFQNEAEKDKVQNDINTAEALFLIKRKDFPGAEKVAAKLKSASSITKVYSSLVQSFVETKNEDHARDLLYLANEKLVKTESDDSAFWLSHFATVAARIEKSIAFDYLGSAIKSLNQKDLDENVAEMDFDVSAFTELAPLDPDRSIQTAEMFSNPMRRIAASAAVLQFRAKIVEERLKALERTSGRGARRSK